MDTRITIQDLFLAKRQGRKFAAVSCYDYTTARLVTQADIQVLLVGDSAAQVVLGFDSTLPATMDFMAAITAAVRRAAPNVCLVADIPFLSFQAGLSKAVENAGRFFTECFVQMVKIEAGTAFADVVKAVSDAGMPVMAHIGIKPQSINLLGRFKAQATTAEQAVELFNLAEQMVNAGATSLLLEGVAAEAAEIITKSCDVPVIGCGSGPACDGQILILPDILGLTQDMPKFAKNYAKLAEKIIKSVKQYNKEVTEGRYPNNNYSYHMKKGELKRLKEMLNNP